MYLRQLISRIPFRSVVFAFILWGNSSYAPRIKKVGFYCDDESIKRPYHGDSVHFICLMSVLLAVFPLIIYLTEALLKKSNAGEEYSNYPLGLLLRIYYTGFLFVLGFTEVLKLSICELRPHFFTTCVPDMNSIKCSDGFITHFNCTGRGSATLLRDSYKSFPSGHASLSCFSFIFLNVYLFSRIKNMRPSTICRWWSLSIPVITFLWTLICCISRILDFRHYWWDVLVGIFIGLIGGFITIRMALKTVLQNRKISSVTKNQ